MSCSNCTSIPTLPDGNCQVFINAPHDYILEKIIAISRENSYPVQPERNYCLVRVDDFSAFIAAIGADGTLTELEQQSVNILPIRACEQLEFGHMINTRNLVYWHALLNAEDLCWILENGSLTVYFQPIVALDTMDIYAYECLSRGVLSDGRLMNPQAMFDTAKKSGLLFNLDRQCRESAIKTAAVKNIHKNIFINFIPSAIYNPEFCLRDTVGWAQQLNLDPYRIVFEVVETEEVGDTEHLISILKYYKEKGFRTALDDVGSGYSTLNMFALLAPDIIKIDRAIVNGIHLSDTKQAIARSLINMARDAKCSVLAEGVETAEELAWFKAMKADYAQGYLFARPSVEPLRKLAHDLVL